MVVRRTTMAARWRIPVASAEPLQWFAYVRSAHGQPRMVLTDNPRALLGPVQHCVMLACLPVPRVASYPGKPRPAAPPPELP